MTNQKAAFIPLKKEYFLEFKNRTKNCEYRRYGGRWTEKNFKRGRDIVLSLGYGKKDRIEKMIIDSYRVCSNKLPEKVQKDIYNCYNNKNDIDILVIVVGDKCF
jgi:hypothetical protein